VPGTICLRTIVVASKDNVSCSLGAEAAILNMSSGVYYGLDPVGAHVWSLLEQPRSVEDLRAAVMEEYEVEPARCEADLLALLEKLRSEGLIEIRTE
jgi:Coenzyme PQQ synthesis protein D (PqqD)